MKRLGSSDSLGAYMSICPNSTDEHSQGNNPLYTREFQTILEGLDEEEECGHVSEKKRRLGVDQVKALEKNFEVENKLEPERKVKLAQELGLQPRQVAIWFQNRRARWKTKQLERDYGILKANYDALKHNFQTLQADNEALLKEIEELKSKANEDEIQVSIKEEVTVSDTEERSKLESPFFNPLVNGNELNLDTFDGDNQTKLNRVASIFTDLKAGSSEDSDSSAILNDENTTTTNNNNNNNNNNSSPIAANSSNIIHYDSPHQFLDLDIRKGSMNVSFQFSDTKESQSHQQAQFVKIEEHNFIGEESCSTFFSEDQAPTLHWWTD